MIKTPTLCLGVRLLRILAENNPNIAVRPRIVGKIKCCGLLKRTIGEKFVKIHLTRGASGELYPVSKIIETTKTVTQSIAFDASRRVNAYAMDAATRLIDEISQNG